MAFFAWFYRSWVSTVWMTALLFALIGIVYGFKGLKGPYKGRAVWGILVGLLMLTWWFAVLPRYMMSGWIL